MLIAHYPDLADGEIEFGSEFPPYVESTRRAEKRIRRLRDDARKLDTVIADPSMELHDEWVAVFDGEVFRATVFDELLAQFEAHGVEPGRAVKHYVGAASLE